MYFLVAAILGLGSGAASALLGLGLVLCYRGTGAVNLAQGAMAMYVAYVYFDLRESGRYLFPIPGLPTGVQVSSGPLPAVPALLLAFATAVFLGLLLHLLIFRPLSNAPPLAKIAASVGVLFTLEDVIAYRFGTNPVSIPNLLPTCGSLNIAATLVPYNLFELAGIAVAAGLVLAATFRFTQFGLRTRAAAENEKGTALIGYSGQWYAGLNWMLGALLAGLAGILIAPLSELTPTNFTLLVVPALAAVLIARYRSFGVTVAAGILIGMADSEISSLSGKWNWFPQIGTQDALPFIVILVALFFLGRSLPTRGNLFEGRLPSAPRPSKLSAGLGAFFVPLAAVLIVVLPIGFRDALITSLVATVMCLSVVVLTGYLGQISLFQYALAGTGGFVMAAILRHVGLAFPIALVVGGVAAAAVGIVAAIPAVRIRGVNLAIVTLAGGWAIEEFFFQNPSYVGGPSGSTLPAPTIFGLNLSFDQGGTVGTIAFGFACLTVVVILGLGVVNIRRGSTGRRFIAVKENEKAAAAAGIDVARTKLLGFALSSFIAGVGGCLIAYLYTDIQAPTYDVLLSVSLLVAAYLGGIGSVAGAVQGGLLSAGGWWYYIVERYVLGSIGNAVEIADLLSGVGLIVVVVQNPEGINGAMRAQFERLRDRHQRRQVDSDGTGQRIPVDVTSHAPPTGSRSTIDT